MESNRDIQEVVSDLKRIKETIQQSNSFIKFMEVEESLKGVLFFSGLLICVLAGLFFYFLQLYGSMGEIPWLIKLTLFVLVGVSLYLLGSYKMRRLLERGRLIKSDLTALELINETYAQALMVNLLPHFAVIILVTVFLALQDLYAYLVPSLSILFGLMYNTMISSLNLNKMLVTSYWLVGSGLLTLFLTDYLHPMATLTLTFGASFLLGALSVHLAQDKERK